MTKSVSKLTVLYDEPFWTGIYERECDGRYEVCRVVFGAEPKDGEVYEYFLKNWNSLNFSPSVEGACLNERRINPKRMQRLVNKELHEAGIGTRAQQALKLMREQTKLEKKVRSKEQKELEQQRRFELSKERKKEKHKGH